MYTEVGGLTAMNLDKKEFNDTVGVDWEAKEMKNEIISEISVDFIGKNNLFHQIYLSRVVYNLGQTSECI